MLNIGTLRTCAVYACFFLSGTAALIYELLWVRAMSLFLGRSQWAVSAVTAAFMAGLALGGWAGGRAAEAVRRRRLPLLYAALEAGVAVYGLCFLPLTGAAQKAALAAGLMDGPLWLQAAVWFLAGFALVLVPTVLIGATFPVFVRWLDDSRSGLGRAAALVYWANTAGAVCGVFAAGFFLIEKLGLRASFLAAAALNLLCALLAYGITSLKEPAASGPVSGTGEAAAPAVVPRAAYVLLFLSGFAALAAQMAWTRSLSLAIGSSVYAFTVILGVFLLGLSSGGGLAGEVFKKTRPGWGAAALAALAAAAGLLFSLSVQNYLPFLLTRLYPLYFDSILPLPAVHLALASLSMFLPALCMGFLFPALIGAAGAAGSSAGRAAGTYTAVNTAGAVCGALAGGFLLVPVLGAEATLAAAVVLYLLAGLLALYLSREPWRRAGLALAPAFALAALFLYPGWDPWILSSGAYLYVDDYRGARTPAAFYERARRRNSLLMHSDGAYSTVGVFEKPGGQRFLRVNGKTDASLRRLDMSTQLLLAYLPRVLHPGRPKNALVVGLGSGVTAGALAGMPGLESVDCVEIEPEMRRAASFFSAQNRRVLEKDNFRLILTDARHFLTGSRKRYDLIVSEPSNPWMAGVAGLYTREAFSLARDRLSEDGIFCQWLQGYALREADFKMVLNTFASVFPGAMLFAPSSSDYLIVGSRRAMKADPGRVKELLAADPSAAGDLGFMGLGDPFVLLAATLVLDDAGVRAFAAGAPVHTDDRMTLEFTAPRSLLTAGWTVIKESLRRTREGLMPEGPAAQSAGGAAELYKLAGEAAVDISGDLVAEPFFRKALEISPGDPRALTGLGRSAIASGDPARAEGLFRQAIERRAPFAQAYLYLGKLYAVRRQADKALACLESGVKKFPSDPRLALALGELYFDRARYADARRLIKPFSTGAYGDAAQWAAVMRLLDGAENKAGVKQAR